MLVPTVASNVVLCSNHSIHHFFHLQQTFCSKFLLPEYCNETPSAYQCPCAQLPRRLALLRQSYTVHICHHRLSHLSIFICPFPKTCFLFFQKHINTSCSVFRAALAIAMKLFINMQSTITAASK
jgi:hypothetical protein